VVPMGAAVGSWGATDGGGKSLMVVVVAGSVVVVPPRVVDGRGRAVVGVGAGVVGGSVAGGSVTGGGWVGGVSVVGGNVFDCAPAGATVAAHSSTTSAATRTRFTTVRAGRRSAPASTTPA
jgi:hypothetical protein